MATTAAAGGRMAIPAKTLEEARCGEEAALRSIYDAHAPAILRRLWKLLGNRARAEELCQDTFSVAFEHLGELRKGASLSAWLHGIAFNLARADNERSRRRRGLLSRERERVVPNPAPEPDAALVHDEVVARLRRAMDPLSAEQREAYVLRVLEGLPLEECAEILRVPVSTVSYRARRAEERVRARFEAEDEA